jgi:hypothetical protein
MNNVYHPDYGYPDSVRLRVCRTAFILGKRKAAKEHSVSLSSVYAWTKVYSFDAVMRAK